MAFITEQQLKNYWKTIAENNKTKNDELESQMRFYEPTLKGFDISVDVIQEYSADVFKENSQYLRETLSRVMYEYSTSFSIYLNDQPFYKCIAPNRPMSEFDKLHQALNEFRNLFVKKIVDVKQIQSHQSFLQSIGRKFAHEYTVSEAFKIYSIIKPFADKLKLVGYDFSQVSVPKFTAPAPIERTASQQSKIIGYNGSVFVVRFPYSVPIFSEIKNLPSAVYEKEESCWKIGISATKELREFAKKHNFEIGDKALAMMNNAGENLEKSYSSEYIELALPLKKNLFAFQTVGVDYGMRNKRVIIADDMGLGKLQSVNSTIVTPYGIKRFGDLKIGDLVIGRNGKSTDVTGVYPQGIKDLYRVEFTDGFHLDVGLEHLWHVQNFSSKKNHILTTGQMLSKDCEIKFFGTGHNSCKEYRLKTYFKCDNGNNKWRIPIVNPVQFFFNEHLPIDPYLLGVWLGDGHKNELTINKNDIDICSYFSTKKSKETPRNNCFQFTLLENDIEYLRLSKLHNRRAWEKFIPEEFMCISVNDRISLLQGLMDTDGYAGKKSTEFSTTSKMLADQVCWIVQSLGGIARLKQKQKTYTYKGEKKQGRSSYSVNIKLTPDLDLFRCNRKAKMYERCEKYLPERYIKNIYKVGKEEAMCISVSAPDHLYVTDHFIVTHNTVQGMCVPIGTDKFPCLVICPKSLRLNWKDEWEAWTTKRVMILDHKNKHQLKHLIENNLIDVVITNYDGAETFFVEEVKTIDITQGERAGTSYEKIVTNGFEKLFKSIICDEFHHCRNAKSRRFKVIKKCCEEKEIIVGLTGTPVVKGAKDLAALLDLVGRIEEFGGRYKFVRAFGEMDKSFFHAMQKPENELTPQERRLVHNYRELNIKLRSTCFIRREKLQVLKDLPDKFRKIVRVPLDNKKDYDHAFFSLQDWLAKNGASAGKIDMALRAQMLVQIGILKQLAAKGKFNAVKEFAEEVIESGEKLIIFCWYNETVQWLKNSLKQYNPVTISGKIDGRDTKDEEIQEAKRKFQNDPETKVIILTYGKGGEGHTLTSASKVAFIELGWTYKDQGQAEDRSYRIGQKNNVECYYFLGEDTIDEHIYKIIDTRRQLEKETTGGNIDYDTTFTDLTKVLMKK